MQTIYLVGLLACLAWAAYVDNSSAREAAVACALWPVVVPLIAAFVLASHGLARVGWCFDIHYSPGGWGVRRPDDGWPGLGLRCPLFELQFWKNRTGHQTPKS